MERRTTADHGKGRRPRRPNQHLLDMLNDAFARKKRERGGRYSFTDLAADIATQTGHKRSRGHLVNIFAGRSVQPEPDVLEDIAIVLGLSRLDVLIVAGWVPDTLSEAVAERNRIERQLAERGLTPAEALRRDVAREDEDLRRLIASYRRRIPLIERIIHGQLAPESDSGGSTPPAPS